MGAKTALLAFADGAIGPALSAGGGSDRARAEELVRRVFPGYTVEPSRDSTLWEDVYPPEDITYATVLPGVELVCDRRLMDDRPSELAPHLLKAGAARRIVMHGMHSVVDWLGFAVWEDGELVRSLSLLPDSGVLENIGEPYDFELPFWAGEHPVVPVPGWSNPEPYPLPFHPLELGELALRALFGFVLEGLPHPADIDADSVALHGFRVTDPAEQAAREAARERMRQLTVRGQTYRTTPDGTFQEIDKR